VAARGHVDGAVSTADELRCALRRFKPYPAYKDSGVEWLGEIPAHWEVKRLKLVAPARMSKLDGKPDEATYVGLEHIESWTGRLLLETQPESVDSVVASFEPGDVIFGKLRPYLAKVARPKFDGVCTSEIIPLRPADGCFQDYLFFSLLNAPFIGWLDSLTYGARMPRVSPEQLGATFMPVPTTSEQRSIAAFLDREAARIDALVAKKEQLIALLQERRTALITQAVTKGLDPNVPMKDSGTEWLGEIPAHWQVKRLWHLTPSRRRIMYGIVLPGPNVDDGVPIVKGGDVSADRLRVERLNRTTREIEAGYVRSRLRGGDLVYAIRGSIGEVAMVPDELEGANLTQDAARVSYTTATKGHWLLYVLRSVAVFAQLEAGALGATISGINIRDLKRALVPVPPRVEQEAIAAFLNQQTAKFDVTVAKIQNAIDRLKELRTSLICAAVMGKIDVRGETV
jgi:type I restriction enzyme S subunit